MQNNFSRSRDASVPFSASEATEAPILQLKRAPRPKVECDGASAALISLRRAPRPTVIDDETSTAKPQSLRRAPRPKMLSDEALAVEAESHPQTPRLKAREPEPHKSYTGGTAPQPRVPGIAAQGHRLRDSALRAKEVMAPENAQTGMVLGCQVQNESVATAEDVTVEDAQAGRGQGYGAEDISLKREEDMTQERSLDGMGQEYGIRDVSKITSEALALESVSTNEGRSYKVEEVSSESESGMDLEDIPADMGQGYETRDASKITSEALALESVPSDEGQGYEAEGTSPKRERGMDLEDTPAGMGQGYEAGGAPKISSGNMALGDAPLDLGRGCQPNEPATKLPQEGPTLELEEERANGVAQEDAGLEALAKQPAIGCPPEKDSSSPILESLILNDKEPCPSSGINEGIALLNPPTGNILASERIAEREGSTVYKTNSSAEIKAREVCLNEQEIEVDLVFNKLLKYKSDELEDVNYNSLRPDKLSITFPIRSKYNKDTIVSMLDQFAEQEISNVINVYCKQKARGHNKYNDAIVYGADTKKHNRNYEMIRIQYNGIRNNNTIHLIVNGNLFAKVTEDFSRRLYNLCVDLEGRVKIFHLALDIVKCPFNFNEFKDFFNEQRAWHDNRIFKKKDNMLHIKRIEDELSINTNEYEIEILKAKLNEVTKDNNMTNPKSKCFFTRGNKMPQGCESIDGQLSPSQPRVFYIGYLRNNPYLYIYEKGKQESGCESAWMRVEPRWQNMKKKKYGVNLECILPDNWKKKFASFNLFCSKLVQTQGDRMKIESENYKSSVTENAIKSVSHFLRSYGPILKTYLINNILTIEELIDIIINNDKIKARDINNKDAELARKGIGILLNAIQINNQIKL
jgi:DNA relaxase NicK